MDEQVGTDATTAAERAGAVERARRAPPGPGSSVELVEPSLPRLPSAVSVVIPAYNEEAQVAQEIHDVRTALDEAGWTYEIIVVDDGSSDETAREAAGTGARVLRHPRNLGYGAALKQGIGAARFGWVLITDADGTYPASSIPHLLARADSAEMVVGARTGRSVEIPISRRPAKWFLRRLAGYLAGQKLPDLNSGLRLMRADLVRAYTHLLPSGFSFTTTITLAAACNGHLVDYVSIDYRARIGDSKIRPRHAFDFTLLILRTIVYFNPLKVFMPLGALLALAGMVKLAYDIVIGNLSESAIFALLAALIVWALGLLADQNARALARR